ncbi:type II toxin-antitoxin system VapC family toxin [Pseudomonas resinovorans]|uniref:Ribonuclease VapC n=1 Tax=Metapseudomonas resinovorans TaxID=53412 RepID=A0ABT4Y1A2_METRE|nr:type II toxin-antitoxin system VapC family toxin [Pseudomonas resinovorans]MDA8482615.1 type II toxin-antitoxin system VapC family toxin [Pseudomonas resinovorans]
MILLDTNVLSEMMKTRPDPNVVAWLDAQPGSELVICSISVAEILYGIARMPNGKRKELLAMGADTLFNKLFAGSILPFDADAAVHYAALVSASQAKRRATDMADAQIAAIARLYSAQVATRNTRDFEELGVALVNPWEGA